MSNSGDANNKNLRVTCKIIAKADFPTIHSEFIIDIDPTTNADLQYSFDDFFAIAGKNLPENTRLDINLIKHIANNGHSLNIIEINDDNYYI